MKPRTGDFIIATAIIICAVIIFGAYLPSAGYGKLVAEISKDGNLIQVVDLNALTEKKTISIDSDIKIVAENGKIKFLESNCHDKICINTGWLTKSGQSAICLPNRTIIKLEGKKKDVDIVVG